MKSYRMKTLQLLILMAFGLTLTAQSGIALVRSNHLVPIKHIRVTAFERSDSPVIETVNNDMEIEKWMFQSEYLQPKPLQIESWMLEKDYLSEELPAIAPWMLSDTYLNIKKQKNSCKE